MFGLTLLLTGVRRASRRGREARRDLRQSRRETAAVSKDRDDLPGRHNAAQASMLENGSRGGDPQPGPDGHGWPRLFRHRPGSQKAAVPPAQPLTAQPAADIPARDNAAGASAPAEDPRKAA